MTIKQFLINAEKDGAEARLQKLVAINAPEVMIEGLRKKVANPELDFKVGGSTELLEIEYKHHEVKKGKGGKVYLAFNDDVLYFPVAKYGRFITSANGYND